jgi:C4-dicarboxylate transporter DctM subunit
MTLIELDNPTGGDGSAVSGPIHRVISTLLTLILAAMVLLPVAEIVARRFFDTDVPGASVYIQHLTLWVGFLGAVLASVGHRHLALSTTNFLSEGRPRRYAELLANIVTAGVTLLLAYGSAQLVWENRESTEILAGGIPAWWSQAVMPLSLCVMAGLTITRAPGGWFGRIITAAACLCLLPFLWIDPIRGHFILWPATIIVLSAFLLGAPVFVAMAGMAMLLFYTGDPPTPVAIVPTNTFQLVTNSTLPAVPLLTIAGYVLAAGGASQRLVTAYRALLGWLPAGMGLMVLAVCAMFTAFTGASGVTILAMGGLVYPSLREEKYPEGFSLGLVTAAGSLGLLFPPSLPVILYGVVAQADIKALFLAGLVPGVVIILLVSLYTVIVGVRAGAPRHAFSQREAARALWNAKWDLGLPLLIIVSIVTGVATIVESAGLAALYSMLVEVVIFRNLHPVRDLPRVLASGAMLVGSVLILMGVALGLTAYLVDAQIPDLLLEWVQLHLHAPWQFLLALNIILLVLGSVLEMYSAIVVLAPLVVPLGNAFQIDPVHLGVVFLANLELGFLFPPMGLNLFLSATRFGQPLPKLYRHAMPFLIIMTVGVLIVTYVESFTTGVLRLFHVQ